DITTEAYPYVAGMTNISSAIFKGGWQRDLGISYSDLMWAATGERLTAQSFERYRKEGGMVVTFTNSEEMIRKVVAHPAIMIASDGILTDGTGHPRGAGCYARVLGRYVREEKLLPLMDAIGKMSLLPARRLEGMSPQMRNKGRIKVGGDADLTLFDPGTVIDRATYEKPAEYSVGIPHVLVEGVFVVRDSKVQEGVFPGQGIRAR
ncbi:MAG: amidohydrolase family protein, partial [Bryobacteraceae bacterium]|nr:amidohydrolase family protein [Bryobacteraceae bacterium]